MDMPKPISERRRSVRISESLPFKIGGRGYDIEAVTVNVSSHGALCLVDRSIPVMAQLEVALSLPAGSPGASRAKKIRMKGVVVRKEEDAQSGRFLIAVFFSDIKPADQKTLNEFIDRRLGA